MVEDTAFYNCRRLAMVSNSFKLGDLVELKSHCKESGRLAIIIENNYGNNNCCRIVFVDDYSKSWAVHGNLIKLSE